MRSRRLVVLGLLGCSEPAAHPPDAQVPDAPWSLPDAGDADAPPAVRVGPLVELPLLASPDPALPYNHSREVTVAARGGQVVVASIHEHFASADSFDTTGFFKRVAVNASTDGGETFGAAVDPGVGDQTTDPVIRASADGAFWLAAWDTTSAGSGAVAVSRDQGASWTPVATDLVFGDKEWIAVDGAGGALFVGAQTGLWTLGLDGTLLGSASPGAQMTNAYVDAQGGAHFATLGFSVIAWDGGGAPTQEGAVLSAGPDGDQYTRSSWSLGETPDGTQWIVRAVRAGSTGSIVLRLRRLPGDEGTDLPISGPGEVAFFPAATLDAAGRLHVVWYDSSGTIGVLKYARSIAADLSQGFYAPLVIDPEATPGAGWYPFLDTAAGGRRLREYIDVVADGDRVHVAWTHAPAPPSRVYASYVEVN